MSLSPPLTGECLGTASPLPASSPGWCWPSWRRSAIRIALPRTTALATASTAHTSSSQAHHATRSPAVPPAPVVTPRQNQATESQRDLQNGIGRYGPSGALTTEPKDEPSTPSRLPKAVKPGPSSASTTVWKRRAKVSQCHGMVPPHAGDRTPPRGSPRLALVRRRPRWGRPAGAVDPDAHVEGSPARPAEDG
jgi:hypothetical protein